MTGNSGWLIDANAFIGRHPRLNVEETTPEQMLKSMDSMRIDRAVVTHTRAIFHSAGEGNELLMNAISAYPRLLACWVMLPDSCGELPPATDYVAAAIEAGVVAFRACPVENVFDLVGPDCEPILYELERLGLPLLLDADQTPWAGIETIALRYPNLAIVVCRTGYRSLRAAAGVMSRVPNVVLDLANLSSQGAIQWLASRFGAHRLVFGTASPVRDPAESIAGLLWSEIDDESVHAIGRRNSWAMFGLPEDVEQ